MQDPLSWSDFEPSEIPQAPVALTSQLGKQSRRYKEITLIAVCHQAPIIASSIILICSEFSSTH